MPSRLWFRLLVGTCLVLAVTLGAVVLLVNKALTGSFQDYVEDQQSARVQRAESILSRYYDRRREWSGVEASVQSVADLMGERLVLTDAQGRVMADSQGALVGEWEREDWRGRRVSIRSQEFAVGTLYISPTLGGPRALDPRAQVFLGTLSSYLAWALLVGVLAAIVLSVGLARWLASPLEALTRAVRRMERGERGQHIDTTVGGEVGALAEAFNALAASLDTVERLRQNMVTDIAHELRTPLSSIRGYLEAIQDGVVEPDEETLATVHREMMQLTRLVDDLQELSLAEARQLHLDRDETDLRELVEWEVRAFLPRAASQRVELAMEAPAELPTLCVDAGRIRQVIGNLLRNALAHTPGGGRIAVEVGRAGDAAVVSVADTGVGIAPADLEHIFERFYRVDKARARRGGGTGLGLTIARELVGAHGGSLVAASEVGTGTTFTMSLPLASPEAVPARVDEPVAAVAVTRQRERWAPLAAEAASIGALMGAGAGVVEALMASAQKRKPQGFLDMFGYAVLIDASVFALVGVVLVGLGAVITPLLGRRLRAAQVVVWGVPIGLVLVGLLTSYRWNQLAAREVAFDAPEVLYPVALILVGSVLAAVVAGFALSAALERSSRDSRRTGGWRRAPTFALVVVLAGASALVGRDQLIQRLADQPAATVASSRATTPRSADAQPPPPTGGSSSRSAPPEQGDPGRATRRPNVLLVTVSGLRADHLGAYGYDKARTPTLDALARQGAFFVNALTSQPDRNPAHAALLTGSYPGSNGVRADLVDRLNPSAPTLAQTMAERGYRTAAIYSWVSFEPGYSGLDRGFHDYLDLTINRPEYLSDNRTQVLAATYERLKEYLALPGAMGDAFSLRGIDEAIDGRADVTTEAAIAWVEQHQDVPFFLWVHYVDPSAPYTPPAPFDEVPDTGCGDACPDGDSGTIKEIEAGAQMSAAQINHLVELYDGEVAFTDQQIGRLLGRMDQLGLDDHTLVVVTSDFGQSFAEHDAWFAGTNLYNASARVPLIVSMPTRLPNRAQVAAPATSVDVAPTILDTIGGGVPHEFEGQSLLPLILGHTAGDDRLAFSELGDRSEAAISDKYWKLIWSDRDQAARLYSLGDDPNELNDRAASEPEATARLLEALREWRGGRRP